MIHELRAQRDTVHWGYLSRHLPPVLSIESGDEVDVETLSYPRGARIEELLTPALEDILATVEQVGTAPHLLTGPIAVRGARPGDVLAIDVLSVAPALGHAYNRIMPGARGLGLLPEDFPDAWFGLLPLDRARREVVFRDDIRIPMRCFFGIMAVAPPDDGQLTSRVPGAFGGNLDITELTAGARLYLPVFNEGALFSVGDGHATQGDGEVDIGAAEASMTGRLRFTVLRDRALAQPMVETPASIITVGIDEDLREAVKIAIRAMIDWLAANHGLTREQAYALCSLAVDLRVSQVVNGRSGIHAVLPRAIFTGSP